MSNNIPIDSPTKSFNRSFQVTATSKLSNRSSFEHTPKATLNQSSYVFRLITPPNKPTEKLQSFKPQNVDASFIEKKEEKNAQLQDVRQRLRRATTTNGELTSGIQNKDNERETNRLREEVQSLKRTIAALTQENTQLKKENGELGSLKQKNVQLEQEIARIKDQYVQTSLDCFNEALRGEFEKIAKLKSELEEQAIVRESLQFSLNEAHSHNQYLTQEIKNKSVIFQRELNSQQQRFDVRLCDKENQIRDLRHSLQTLQQRFNIISNEIKIKDEFLLQLGQRKI